MNDMSPSLSYANTSVNMYHWQYVLYTNKIIIVCGEKQKKGNVQSSMLLIYYCFFAKTTLGDLSPFSHKFLFYNHTVCIQ